MLPARPRFRTSPTVATLVAATLVGVYLLLVVGVSTALLDGAAACPTWPLCDGVRLPTADAPLALVVAWAHRLVAVGVGALVLVTGVVAWTARPRPSRRVRVALAVGVVVYPIQVAVGALTAVGGAPTPLSALHLALAVGLFTALLLALLWQLEAETPRGEDEGPRASTTGRAPTRPSRPAVTATASTTEPEPNPPLGLRARAAAYLALTKPKLWWLLCLVALASMGIAGGRTLGPGTVFATLTGGVLAIAASGTFNNVLERDLDRQMARTGDRPLVAGDIPVRRAVGFGLALALGSVAVFLVYVNVIAAALGVLAILFYSVVYTLLLKPNTTQNIVVGGAVGAFPALIGWAAVTDTVGIPAVVLGAVIFLWTPAHFYNLAMAYREDYARAGFPMLPVVRGERTTRRHVLLYLGATMLAAIALGVDPRLDLLYAVTAATLGTVFLAAVVLLFRERSRPAAFRAFHASNAYLGCLLLAVLLDTFLV